MQPRKEVHSLYRIASGLADGLSQMTFAGTRRTEKQGVFVASDEGAGRQVEDQAAIHLLIEGKVEVIEGLLGVAELGLLCPPLQQALATPSEFVGDQTGEQVDGGERFGLCLAQTGLQHGGI
jgi:hypothetical protein